MVLDEFRLDGKVAIVTGAGRGLGKAMAVYLASSASDYVTGETVVIDGGVIAY